MTRIVREADAQRDTRLLREFAASGISVGCANTVLNPVGEYADTYHCAAKQGRVPGAAPGRLTIPILTLSTLNRQHYTTLFMYECPALWSPRPCS